jgi:outer membrane lipoprotein carrier protein
LKNIFPIFVVLLALSVAVWGREDKKLDEIVNQVQSKYEKIEDFHSKFTQEATVKALNKVQKAEGEVWFKKPGRMRWNYYRPAKDEIVSDGSTIWFYNYEEKQVIKSPLDRVADTPTTTTFLSGLGNLKEQFKAQFSEPKSFDENGNYLIDLTPKQKGEEYDKFTIAVDRKTMFVRDIYLYDPFGNLTKVKLEDIEINKGIPDSLFKFKVPKGVEIIEAPSTPQREMQ